jgi:cytochrome P450
VKVIMDPVAVQLDKRTLGDDDHEWIPKRWARTKAVIQQMEYVLLRFGHGPQVSIGKHISEVEMYRLLTTIL